MREKEKNTSHAEERRGLALLVEKNQRKSARKKDQKNSSRRGAQIETADGRREKTCVIVHDF